MAVNHAFIRTLHIYGSMLAAVLILLFAVTGLLLNNAVGLGLDEGAVTRSSTAVPVELAKAADPDSSAIVASLRESCDIWGDLGAFEVDDKAIRVVFRGPGHTTEALINRADGSTQIETESRGATGTLLDLHRGKHAGAGWHVLMDVLAILLAASALTGIILCFAVPKRRRLALGLLAASSAFALGAYFLLV